MKHLCAIALAALLAACAPGMAGEPAAGDVRQMDVERLPDLNVPRNAHTAAYVGGELTVIGGHSTGFVPTPTAEYYRDGAWHLVNSLFPHDYGFGVVLPSEEVLVGGGCTGAFGEGQTQGVELYDPRTHGFSPLPIMDQRRTRPGAARLSDGTILISGNWYYPDYISTYSIPSGPATVRRAEIQRAGPFILQSSADNAVIFSIAGSRDEVLEPVVERLKGDPFEVPLLREWEDWALGDGQQMSQYFIGDETVGGYAWLLPVRRKADGQPGLLKVVGEDFSVLETEGSLLANAPDGAEMIRYPALVADRDRACAWLIQSVEGSNRIYVTRVDYRVALRGGKAPLTLYRADLPDGMLAPVQICPVLLPGGRIAIVGGRTGLDEYHPSAAAFILHTEPVPAKAGLPWWLALAGVLLGGGAVSLLGRRLSKRAGDGILRQAQDDKDGAQDDKDGAQDVRSCHSEQREESVGTHTLMSRILALMEKEELWRQKRLKVSDLATHLGTNATYISACINGQAGKSFPEFLNDYRLRHAQRLMTEHAEMLLADVADECGFSNEQSFFRTFKARTGLTPQEWKASGAQL